MPNACGGIDADQVDSNDMSSRPNPRLVFNAIPQGIPVSGVTTVYDTEQVIDVETVDLKGGFLVRTLALSLDPFMRNRMRPEGTADDMAAFPLGRT